MNEIQKVNGFDGYHIGPILIDSSIRACKKMGPSQDPIKKGPGPTGPFLLTESQRVTDGHNRKKLIHPLGDQYDWT